MPGIDIFKDKGFSQCQMDLDSEMKCLQAMNGISRIMKLVIMVRLFEKAKDTSRVNAQNRSALSY